MSLKLITSDSISAIPQEAWDRLVDDEATPFLRWAWLEALESSGCATPETGWTPIHFTLWDGAHLVAAAPAYIKEHSDGDFSRDWEWAEAAARAGIAYYPKLCFTVPFTPCSGRRILTRPGEDRQACVRTIVAAAHEAARELGVRSIHVLFPLASEADELAEAGMARRVSFQYHWRNQGYADPAAFLACFDAKKRHQARRERAQPDKQGIHIRTVRAPEVEAWADRAYELHCSTVDKLMWGRRWLNRAFYRRVFQTMPDSLEVVAAEQGGRLVAGAFNVASATRLYGRYWGCFEEHQFLHFNVCLYHSIDECIRRGLQAFEGGAGGEHKVARGFEPAETYSAHSFLDERLAQPIRSYIGEEALKREAALARWRAESPILKRKPPMEENDQT